MNSFVTKYMALHKNNSGRTIRKLHSVAKYIMMLWNTLLQQLSIISDLIFYQLNYSNFSVLQSFKISTINISVLNFKALYL